VCSVCVWHMVCVCVYMCVRVMCVCIRVMCVCVCACVCACVYVICVCVRVQGPSGEPTVDAMISAKGEMVEYQQGVLVYMCVCVWGGGVNMRND